MAHIRILQALAGLGLAVTGIAGLSTLSVTPAAAHGGDAADVDMQRMADQCHQMMEAMLQMDGRAMSRMMEDMGGMHGTGMADMMGGH